MYNPSIFKLPKSSFEELEKNVNPQSSKLISSENINLPLMSLAFHTFITRTKNGMNITKNIESDNKFYYIVEPFSYNIPDYKESLESLSLEYFNIKKFDFKMSRNFYKPWEMILFFNLIDFKTLNCLCFSNESNVIVSSISRLRDKLKLNNKKDEYLEVNDMNSLNNMCKKISKSEDYISLLYLDSIFKWTDNIAQEGESYSIIISELIAILTLLNKNGNLIIKIYETFTKLSVKLIYIISSLFEDAYIYKPYFSMLSDTERYLVCKNFKFDQKKDKKKISNMIKLFTDIESKISDKLYIEDIYPLFTVPTDYHNMFRFINIKLSNVMQITINEIIKYIKGNNYYGKEYHTFRENEITSTKWWVSTFFKADKIFDNAKDELNKLLLLTLKKNEMEYGMFMENIIKN